MGDVTSESGPDEAAAAVQWYISHKLKGVAALPWRQLTIPHTCLNIIIDNPYAWTHTSCHTRHLTPHLYTHTLNPLTTCPVAAAVH